jgi:hypothetical protein
MLWIISVLGLALMLAPFIFNYSDSLPALWASLVLGAVIAVTAGYKALVHDNARWENWVVGITGILAVIAPFLLGFNVLTTALWTSIVVGVVVAILAYTQVSFGQAQTR